MDNTCIKGTTKHMDTFSLFFWGSEIYYINTSECGKTSKEEEKKILK